MENRVLNITWCYPDLLNLHGDRGNIMALEKIGELLDIEVNVDKVINLEDPIDFKKTDILFFNVGELKMVKPMVEALRQYEKELNTYIESGKMIIAIGTTGALFSKHITRHHESFDGLGFLDMTCQEREMVYGDDLIFQLREDESMTIAGNQIQLVDFQLNSDVALGKVVYGYGNCGDESKLEGAKYKNLIFTNCLGPLFVKNPWYAEKLIKVAMKAKGNPIEKDIDVQEYEIEKQSLACITQYNAKK